jgi:hypothetical protein
MRFITSGAGGGATLVNFVPRPATDVGSAQWFEDSSSTGKSPGIGVFTAGTPVIVQTPEPFALTLLEITSVGLLARRRRTKRNATS